MWALVGENRAVYVCFAVVFVSPPLLVHPLICHKKPTLCIRVHLSQPVIVTAAIANHFIMYVLSTIFDLTDTVDLLATPIGYCNLFYSIYLPFCLCNLDVNYFSLQLALLEIIACYNVNICEHRTSCVWEHLFVLFCLL